MAPSEFIPFISQKLLHRYKIFLKDCPNNELSKDGFVQIYQKAFPFGDPCEFADYIFRAFDEDDSGKISFREFICALSVTSRGSLEEKLKCTRPRSASLTCSTDSRPLPGAFQLYDIDRNGTIVYDELLEIVQAIYKMTGLMVEFPPDEDTPEYV